MIKVSVVYPNGSEATFNRDYYSSNHLPMVRKLLGDALKGAEIDIAVAGGQPGEQPAFVAAGHLYFDSVSAFEGAFGPHGAQIMADIPNYTNIQPQIVISEAIKA